MQSFSPKGISAAAVAVWLFLASQSIQAQPSTAVCPPGGNVSLTETGIVYLYLELDDGCVIHFDTSIGSANITVVTLTLHGHSTFDLSPTKPVPAPAGKPLPPPPITKPTSDRTRTMGNKRE